jgi:diguanylate cyclase (GGDEF)-like protein
MEKRLRWGLNPNYQSPPEPEGDLRRSFGQMALGVIWGVSSPDNIGLTGLPAIDAANRVVNNYESRIAAEKAEKDRLSQENIVITQERNKAIRDGLVDTTTNCFNENFWKKYKAENFNPDYDRNNIALFNIDINNFSDFNTRYGHKGGDEHLAKVSDFLKFEFHNDDIVVHPHGDEFYVICRDDKGFKDSELSERVKSVIEAAKRTRKDDVDKYIDIAIGYAIFDGQLHDGELETNLDQTMHRADQNMFKQKEAMKG